MFIRYMLSLQKKCYNEQKNMNEALSAQNENMKTPLVASTPICFLLLLLCTNTNSYVDNDSSASTKNGPTLNQSQNHRRLGSRLSSIILNIPLNIMTKKVNRSVLIEDPGIMIVRGLRKLKKSNINLVRRRHGWLVESIKVDLALIFM